MFKLLKPHKKIATTSIVEQPSTSEAGGIVANVSNKMVLVRDKPSVISEGCAIEGVISSDGILLLDGKISGSVTSDALTVGKSGQVQGKVSCKILHIKGFLAGEADCEELVIDATAVIEADIRYKRVKAARGAVIVGTLLSGTVATSVLTGSRKTRASA